MVEQVEEFKVPKKAVKRKMVEQTEKEDNMTFDICDYYPSISEELLSDAIKYAEKYVKTSSYEKDIIVQMFMQGNLPCLVVADLGLRNKTRNLM